MIQAPRISCQSVDEPALILPRCLRVLLHGGGPLLRGDCQCADAGKVLRAGPPSALLPAARGQEPWRCAGSQPEGPRSADPACLVRAEGGGIHAKLGEREGDFSQGLHGIGVQQDLPAASRRELPDGAGDLRQRLDGPCLVVDEHDRDHQRVLVQGIRERLRVYDAVGARSHSGAGDPMSLENARLLVHRGVFYFRCDDPGLLQLHAAQTVAVQEGEEKGRVGLRAS